MKETASRRMGKAVLTRKWSIVGRLRYLSSAHWEKVEVGSSSFIAYICHYPVYILVTLGIKKIYVCYNKDYF